MSDLTLQQALDRDPGYRTTAENLMADRIEELETALREIAKGKHVDPFGNILDQPSREADIARRALKARL